MSCNCGCHPPDNKPPATGWRKFVLLIVGAVVVGALIAGAVLKQNSTAASRSPTERAASAAKP